MIGKKIKSKEKENSPINSQLIIEKVEIKQEPLKVIQSNIIGKKIETNPNTSMATKNGYTRLICLIPGKFVVQGNPSRTGYIFEDDIDGRTVLVHNEDLPDLLSKKIKQGCCGNRQEEKQLFQIYE